MSTAVRPPKVRLTPSAIRMGSCFLTPGAASPMWSPVVLTGLEEAVSLDKSKLLPVSEDALWHEYHDQHDRDPNKDESDLTGLHLRHEWEPAGLDRTGDEAREEGQQHPEHDRAEDGPEDGRSPAEEQDRVDEERQRRLEVRRHDGTRQHEEDARHGAEQTAEHEALHLVG